MTVVSPWFNFGIALALGLLIGLERERSKGEGPARRPAGIRTFALSALLGAVAVHVGGAVLFAVACAGVAAFGAVSYLRAARGDDPGLTTVIGLAATPYLGGLAMSDPLLASGLSVAVAVVFAAKKPLHQFVKGVLTDNEINDGFILAVATLLIWPQLPDRYLGPEQALNPHSLWLLVILVLAIGACGHAAIRALGTRYGLPATGLASGFVSSTATIASMAGLAKKDPSALTAAVAGASLSTVATFIQMALLLLAISEPVLRALAPVLAAGSIGAVVYALAFTLSALTSSGAPSSEPGSAFSILAGLGLAATMAGMLIATAFLKNWLGEAGVLASAALAGFIDTHSAAISVASLAAAGKMAPQTALWPILAAMTSNALMKIIMAIAAGSSAFALRLVPGLVLSMAAAWAAATLLPR